MSLFPFLRDLLFVQLAGPAHEVRRAGASYLFGRLRRRTGAPSQNREQLSPLQPYMGRAISIEGWEGVCAHLWDISTIKGESNVVMVRPPPPTPR